METRANLPRDHEIRDGQGGPDHEMRGSDSGKRLYNRPMISRSSRRQALIRFFTEQPVLPVKEVAALLGRHPADVLSRAREQDVLLPGNQVAWSDAALWVLHEWPRARLFQMLGKYARALPSELHLTPIRWRLPLYLVRALEKQAHLHDIPVEDEVANTLDLAIDDETVNALKSDPAFRAAYNYPEDQDERKWTR